MELQVHASRRRSGSLDQVKRKTAGMGEIGIELRDGETAPFHLLAIIRRKNGCWSSPHHKASLDLEGLATLLIDRLDNEKPMPKNI